MLAELGTRLRPAATEPPDPALRARQARTTRRRQLVALREQEATRLQQTADAEARADIKSLIALLDRRSIAALAGLAPIARDSGKSAGRRTIGGGRPIIRAMLFIAGLRASRREATFRDFRVRREVAGKPVKAAITATARKLSTVLDARLAAGTDYRPVISNPG